MISAAPPKTTPHDGREMLDLSRAECLYLLSRNRFGRLAVNLGGTAPVVRPVNYVFDERSQSIAFRTALGSKLHALLHSARAAFEIDSFGEDGRTGWSVIIIGATERVTTPGEIRRLERLGLEPWDPGDKPYWIRIRASTVTGRRLVDAADQAAGYRV